MKKIFWGAMVLLIIASVLFSVLPVCADDGENFEKAGQQALQEKEKILQDKRAGLEMFVQEVAKDQVITKDEMVGFKNRVEDFYKNKERFDGELKLYSKATSVALNEGYGKAVGAYFDSNALFKEDVPEGKVREFFARETGANVVVKKGAVVDDLCAPSLFLIIVAFVLLVIGCGCLVGYRKHRTERAKEASAVYIAFGLFLLFIGLMTLLLI